MKNILFVNDFAKIGGAEKALLDLIAGMERGKFTSAVLLLEAGPLQQAIEEHGGKVSIIAFPQEILRAPFAFTIARTLKLAKHTCQTIRKLRAVAELISQHKYDFVITNSLKALIVVTIARMWATGARQHFHYLHYFLPTKKGAGTRLISWFLSRTDCLICNSEATLKQVQWHNITCRKTAIVRQGFDRITPINGSPVASNLIIGSAGRLSPVKNFEFLIDVASLVRMRHPALRVYIAGVAYTESDRRYEAKLRRYIEVKGMTKMVSFKGFVDNIWGFMDSIHVFMLCSHTESFGRVLAEAMWSGKPIIASRVGAIPEIVKNEVTGYTVPVGDVQEAARLVHFLIDRPEQARKVGLAARIYAEKQLSYKSYVAEWQKVLLGL